MAGATELAQGYVSLSVSTKGVGSEIKRSFSGASRDAEREGKQAGRRFESGFKSATRNLVNIGAFVAVTAALRGIVKNGLPDFTFGMEKAARMATLVAGALVSVAAAGAPVLALAGGLATGFAAAGGGAVAFAGLVKPAFTAVFTAVGTATKAQDAYNAAVKSGDTEGQTKALADKKAALAALTPEQRKAAEATLSLRDAFVKQSESFAKPYLGLYTKGVKTLQGLIPSLVKIAKPAGDELAKIFDAGNDALKSSGMKKFVDFMSKNVGPAIHRVAVIVGNLGATIGNIFVAANPIAATALTLIGDLTDQLREASGAGGGLKDFFKLLEPDLARVGDLISNAFGLLGSLLKAAMPLAAPVLDFVNTLVSALTNLFKSSDFADFVNNIGDILSTVAPLFDIITDALGRIFKALSGQLLAVLPQLVTAAGDFVNVLADVLIGISPLLPPLIELVAALVTGLLPAIYPIVYALRKALVPVVHLLAEGVKLVTPYIKQFADYITQATGPGGKFSDRMKELAAKVLPIVLKVFRAVAKFVKEELVPRFIAIGGAIQELFKVVAPILLQIYGKIKEAFIDNLPAIMEAFGTIKEIVTTYMDYVLVTIRNVTKLVSIIWKRWGKTILAVIGPVFEFVVNLIKNALKIISGVIKIATGIMTGNWRQAWQGIKQVFSGVMGIITGGVKAGMKVLKAVFGGAMDSVHKKVTSVLNKVRDAFKSAVGYIKKAWKGVQDATQKPITWVKENVYNKVLVPVWNRVAGLVGATKLQAFSTGGIDAPQHGVRPGYTPGRDTHAILVGGGEAVMRPEWTLAAGKNYVDEANKAARLGGVKGAKKFIKQRGLPPVEGRFAGGGIVGWIKKGFDAAKGVAGDIKDWALGGLGDLASAAMKPLRDLIARELTGSLVATTSGKIANKAMDKLIDKIKGVDKVDDGQGDPGGPEGTGSSKHVTWKGGTFTERFKNTLIAAQKAAGVGINVIQGGFRPKTALSGTSHQGDAIDTNWNSKALAGLRSKRVAAWHRTPAQGFAHHIHGVPLKGAGFAGGSGVWQAGDYTRGGDGLKNGGVVPMRTYDTGGYLRPGYTLAYNGTNKNERIRTHEQEKALATPTVGSLTLISTGDTNKDLDNVMFKLRTIRRGGRP